MKRKRSERKKTYETYQYDFMLPLGPWTSYNYLHDPIHLTFVFARYKFVARMLAGKKSVLEVGCGDAVGTPLVAQLVKNLTAIDIDPRIIRSNKKRLAEFKNIEFEVLDFQDKNPGVVFDAVYSVDVFEHIEPVKSDMFMQNTCSCLSDQGVCLIGTPNITAEKYASPQSKAYHVNLQSADSLRSILDRYFHNVFIFSMNDEVVHTGFFPMAHYLWGMGVGKRL